MFYSAGSASPRGSIGSVRGASPVALPAGPRWLPLPPWLFLPVPHAAPSRPAVHLGTEQHGHVGIQTGAAVPEQLPCILTLAINATLEPACAMLVGSSTIISGRSLSSSMCTCCSGGRGVVVVGSRGRKEQQSRTRPHEASQWLASKCRMQGQDAALAAAVGRTSASRR